MIQTDIFAKPKRLTITPREYQNEAHDNAFRLFDNGERGALVRIFTGGGKTITACLLADTWLNRGPDYRVMVVSYEKQLVWQFAQEISDVLGIEPGIEMEKEYAGSGHKIVVASRQSLAVKNKELDTYPRLEKYNPELNWLLIYDEAHKHAYKLKTVHQMVDHFDVNPNSKRAGLTATVKRFDGVSIGDRMFPGIAVDYPLFARKGRSAVRDGYAVPYKQKYIAVAGVDFERPELFRGIDADANMGKAIEEELTKICGPMLDLAGDRSTLIFSPTVEVAKNVAHYVNARRPDQAQAVYGTIPPDARKEVYRDHQAGKFQFLSVCGLCREGYNDPNVSCIAVFRPVSAAASSLAEQMKGRGSRPMRDLINGVEDPAERVRLIQNSAKPDCLIIDLVGITGLADCASTISIYDDGLPDEVKELAQQKLLDGEEDIEEAIDDAERDIAAEKQRIKEEREAAERKKRDEYERRAAAGAAARYSEHDVGVGEQTDPNMASDRQIRYIRFLGLELYEVSLTKRQAGRIITQIHSGAPIEDVARTNRIAESHWVPAEPTPAQRKFLEWKHIRPPEDCTPLNASDLISAYKDPSTWCGEIKEKIASASDGELDFIGRRIGVVRRVLRTDVFDEIATIGRERRAELAGELCDF